MKKKHYFKYYLISLVSIFLWSIVLQLQENIQANIVTLVISTIVALYMVEGVLIWTGSNQLLSERIFAAKRLGIEFDSRTKMDVIRDLALKGVNSVPVVSSSNLVSTVGTKDNETYSLLPLGGVSNKTTVYNNESGKYLIYESDRYGFNNPNDQWDLKPVDWLLIGDSFTQGAAVDPGQEMSAQIRLITQDRAISLGMRGNSPLSEYASLVEYGKKLMPLNVLWIYYEGNDLIKDLQRDKKNSLLMRYMHDGFSQNLISRQQEINKMLGDYISNAFEEELLIKTRWTRLPSVRKLIDFDDSSSSKKKVEFNDPLFKEILTKSKRHVSDWGGNLYFVYLPEYTRYAKEDVSNNEYRNKSKVLDIVRNLGIPVIDIHQEVFSKNDDPLSLFPLRLSGHYNAEGYEEVAKAVVSKIKKYKQGELKSR